MFLISLISSTPLLLAASISTISISSSKSDKQTLHFSHKSPVSLLRQFTALEKILAILVLPVPLGPLKMYAWPILPVKIEFSSIFITTSWPTTSENVFGLYFLYNYM